MTPPATPTSAPPGLITRDRSDTLDSGISGSSSFLLQTPSTPSILHVLDTESRAQSTQKNPTTTLHLHPASISPSPPTSANANVIADDEALEARLARERALSVGSISSRMFFIDLDEADIAQDSPALLYPPTVSHTGGTRAADSEEIGYPFPPVLGLPVRDGSTGHYSGSSPAIVRPHAEDAVDAAEAVEADKVTAKKGMKQATRAKLERSRSSLRSLSAKLKYGDERTASVASATELNGATLPTVPKRPSHARLRSLFSLSSTSVSRSRSGSVASTRSAILTPVPAPAARPDVHAPVPAVDQATQNSLLAGGPALVLPPSSPDLVESALVPAPAEIAQGSVHRPRAASEPLSSSWVSTDLVPVPAAETYWTGQARAASKARARRRNVDMFGTMLPREIQVMILRRVAEACTSRRGVYAMTAFKGRKELIKLSRVSKQWRSLCLDGQLWSIIDLVPLAPVIHPRTLEAILSSTRHCIASLSLRGLDAAQPWPILNALRQSHGGQLPGLATLDLRGCRSFTDSDLLHLLRIAPNLRRVNMKGLQRVNRAVLKQLATLRRLEDVDLSRCGIDMDGLAKYLARLDPEQMARMRIFRCAGLKGPRGAARDVAVQLGRMGSLEVLDMGGTALDDEAVRAWIGSYELNVGPSCEIVDDELIAFGTIRHLRLTACEHLGPKALKDLTGRLPQLKSFELAGVPKVFRAGRDHDLSAMQIQRQLERDRKAVERFLGSCEQLQRVDLDDFGTRDGGVSNEMIEALEGEAICEVNIAESGMGVDVECLVRFVRRCKRLRVLNVDSTTADDRVLAEWHKHRHGPNTCLSMLDCRDATAARYAEVAQNSRTREGRRGYEYAPFAYSSGEVGDPVWRTSPGVRRAEGSTAERAEVKIEVEVEDEEEVAEGASALLRRGAGSRASEQQYEAGNDYVGTGAHIGRPAREETGEHSGQGKGLIKTAWAWKRIGVARPWREERDRARDAAREEKDNAPALVNSKRGELAEGRYAGATRPGLGRRRRRGSWWTSYNPSGNERADGIDGEVDVGGACVVM